MKIWFDIDDVLCDTARYICEKNNNIINWVPFTFDERTTYALSDNSKLWFKNYDESEEYYRDLFLWEGDLNTPILKWAKEVFRKLKERWDDIFLITSRPLEYEEHTKLWLNKNFPLNSFKEIHFIAKENLTKGQIAENLKLDYFVEDHYDYCKCVASRWIKTFMITTPYNKDIEDLGPLVERISSLNEIFDKI